MQLPTLPLGSGHARGHYLHDCRPMHAFAPQVAIASHFGRPQPKKQSWAEMRASPHSLAVVASALASRLGPGGDRWAGMAPDCVGPEAQAWVGRLLPGQACLLENTRFHAGDVDNDPAFAKALAELCDIFVCDAFGVMHRDQASVTVGGWACVCMAAPRLIPHRSLLASQLPQGPLFPLCSSLA